MAKATITIEDQGGKDAHITVTFDSEFDETNSAHYIAAVMLSAATDDGAFVAPPRRVTQ